MASRIFAHRGEVYATLFVENWLIAEFVDNGLIGRHFAIETRRGCYGAALAVRAHAGDDRLQSLAQGLVEDRRQSEQRRS